MPQTLRYCQQQTLQNCREFHDLSWPHWGLAPVAKAELGVVKPKNRAVNLLLEMPSLKPHAGPLLPRLPSIGRRQSGLAVGTPWAAAGVRQRVYCRDDASDVDQPECAVRPTCQCARRANAAPNPQCAGFTLGRGPPPSR